MDTENKYLITSDEALQNAGIEPEDFDTLDSESVPACCSEGCEVEPDGVCEHLCPSVLVAMGII